MKRLGILLVVLGATALLVGSQAAPALRGNAAAAGGIGNGSVHGIYAFSASIHDPNGQEGAAVASMVFDGAGHVSGRYSLTQRGCPSTTDCGQTTVIQAPYAGTYNVQSDGSASLEICITLPSSLEVKTTFEGAFSNAFKTVKLVETQLASNCTDALLMPQPNVTSGTAEKL
jgi:hypothetical protein